MPPDPTHLRWPPALSTRPDGSVAFATVAQDSDEEIRRGLAMACELRPGQLDWDPDLGVPDPLGSTDPDLAADLIQAALTDLEPRAAIVVDVRDSDNGRSIHPRILTS
ncbi:hypothetical protein [Patulibacter medicamentivorans]|nr:hypothetical protein [Patulibacter medicamentivorans]